METLLHDLRYGVRMLRKSPSFTAIAVLTLALGIGSTVAIFSVVDQVLLHSLPYPDADRIMYVSQTERGGNELHYASSPANYLDWVAQNHVFSVMAASRGWQGNLGGDRPERVRLSMTTASLFPLFAVHPMLGRGLESEDEEPSNDHVAVLSYGLWNRRFGADPGLINQSITLNNETYTVVGVMPSNFLPDGYGELWVPSPWGVPSHPLVPSQDPRQFRDRNYLDVWGRLKPGVTQHQAEQEMSAIARRLEKQYPDSNDGIGVGMMSLQDSVVSDIRPVLYVLLAAVAFVLLIGCTNVANLLLARSSGRTREISIRIALGAGRRRIVSQLLTESVLLAVAGGLLGIVIAAWAVPTLVALGPSEIRDYGNIGVNLEALAFAVVVSILTGVLFGLAPALHASEGKVSDSLKEGERGSTAQRGRTRTALVVAEVALSLILLIGAGLTVRSFVRVLRVDPGFDASHLLVFGVGLPPSASADEQDRFYRQVAEKLETLPGVQSAGAVSRLPLSGGNSGRSFKLPGSAKDYSADIRVETPRYLQTMGVSLLKGRYLDEHDIAGATPVIVVNEAFTKSVFPGEDPIGKYITDFGPGMDKLQIVGVVGNVRHVALEAAPRAEVYLPFGQEGRTHVAHQITFLAIDFIDGVVYLFQVPVVEQGHHDAQSVQLSGLHERVVEPVPVPELFDFSCAALQAGPADRPPGSDKLLSSLQFRETCHLNLRNKVVFVDEVPGGPQQARGGCFRLGFLAQLHPPADAMVVLHVELRTGSLHVFLEEGVLAIGVRRVLFPAGAIEKI